ncbi:MAG TPA: DNA replication/repair protein RecF [Devosia sp.]|nr:DNA replication/repair protein RecF [Devosia sp.]
MSKPARYISRLRLTDFRSYESAALDIEAANVVLTGANGAGKTNLIEAVSLLSPGRGLRGVAFENLARIGAPGPWAVASTLQTPGGEVDLGTGANPGKSGRRVRINGANATAVEDLAGFVRLLWLTPAMDGLFTGAAGDRRRFLDRLVMTLIPDHALSVSGFEKSMRQRNRLLEDNADPDWIGAVEVQMADFAAAMHFARADSLAHLQQLASLGVSSAFPTANLALDPVFADGRGEFNSSSALEFALMEHWRQNRGLDRAAKRTLVGPHRVDMQVTHLQKSMPAKLCSTGEQKALLIGLILAHARLVSNMTGITPVLLLDEVAAHLDPDRRIALFDALADLQTQVWMTGTDPMLFEGLEGDMLKVRVEEGRLLV